jgi:hypothetical protein
MGNLHEIRMDKSRRDFLMRHMGKHGHDIRDFAGRVFVATFEERQRFVTTDGRRMGMVDVSDEHSLPNGMYDLLSWSSMIGNSFIIRGPLPVDAEINLTAEKLLRPISGAEYRKIDIWEHEGTFAPHNKKREADFSFLVGGLAIETGYPINAWYLGDAYHRELTTIEWCEQKKMYKLSGEDMASFIKSMVGWNEY